MGRWIQLHCEVLCYLYSSTNTILLTKSRRMRWIEHMADMGEKRKACRVWWGILKGPLGRPRQRGEIIGGHQLD